MIDREGHKDSEEWSEYTGTLRGHLKRLFFGEAPAPARKKRKPTYVKEYLFSRDKAKEIVQKYAEDFGAGVSLDGIEFPCPFPVLARKMTKAYCPKCGGYVTMTGTNVAGFDKFGRRKSIVCNFTPRQRKRKDLLQRCRECAEAGHNTHVNHD